ARHARGVGDGLGSTNMHAFVRLRSDLAVDAREMRDRLAPGERSTKRVGVVGRRRREFGTRPEDGRVARVNTACDKDDLVPIREKRTGQVTTHEASPAGHADPTD